MATNLTVEANRVIIAIPPILAVRINHEPALPLIKSQLLERSAPTQGIKWHAVYKEAFWRKNGLTEQGADMDEVPNVTIDCSPAGGEPGIIAGFAFGPSARKLADYLTEERLQVWRNGLKNVLVLLPQSLSLLMNTISQPILRLAATCLLIMPGSTHGIWAGPTSTLWSHLLGGYGDCNRMKWPYRRCYSFGRAAEEVLKI